MENLIVIKKKEQLQELLNYIQQHEFLAFDTETTGTDKDAKIIGFSVAAEYDKAYYVITRYWDKDTQAIVTRETEDMAKEVISSLIGKSLVMHNAVFDCWMVQNNYNIDLMPHVHTDTMILAHLLNENRHNGLKELGTSIFGESAREEQLAMKASVTANGGLLTKDKYELYKGDEDLIAKYGAKDTILTIKLFYLFVEQLMDEGLDKFFYEDESMPLLRGPTYDLNTTGLRVDPEKLQTLKATLEADIMSMEAFIYKEIWPHVKDKYPGDKKTNKFNIKAPQQLSWLLFEKLGNTFGTLTDGGKELCKDLGVRIPYSVKDKKELIQNLKDSTGQVHKKREWDHKKQKEGRPKKIGDYWKYLALDKKILGDLASKYEWVATLLEYRKTGKLLDTYVLGIQEKMRYNIIRSSFLQHGTTSGRYSSKAPNFQNLPRKDKRIKSCIVSRPGKVFVGADYAQLEPRVFASMSKDETLMGSFAKGLDFYSVVGAPIFNKNSCSLVKDEEGSFSVKYPDLRDKAKVVALATPYGRTANFMASEMKVKTDEAQTMIDNYFKAYPKVELMMLESHEIAKKEGRVLNLFGRPRRIPEAKEITSKYGHLPHGELPYEARTLLNLAMNHRIQSTGASIMNRAAISAWKNFKSLAKDDPRWLEIKIVLQVHDELILEGPEALAEDMVLVLKDAMESTVVLPGVDLVAEPKVAKNLADLK